MRQTLFIVQENPAFEKLVFPKEAVVVFAKTPDQIVAAVDRAESEDRRIVVLAVEGDTGRLEALLNLRATRGPMPAWGFVVIAKDPVGFLHSKVVSNHLLDVITEKTARKELEFFLLKSSKLMSRWDGSTASRIGPELLLRLNEIFIGLSAERDPAKLLESILLRGIELSGATEGTLYLVQEEDGDLDFRERYASNGQGRVERTSVSVHISENSLCGYVALTGKPLNIPELSQLRAQVPYAFFRNVDHGSSHPIVSVITLPLRDARQEIRAILQLINKRSPTQPIAFDTDDESLLMAFGTQSAVCLETIEVHGDVQRLFEGFVKASITAIESRDPSTGGHSERVARMCVGLARATSEITTGIYRSVNFKEEEIKELEYAALLHDFGKIGVREEVLVKAKKLYPYQLEAIQERLKTCKAAAKIHFLDQRLKLGEGAVAKLQAEYEARVREVDSYWNIIVAANEPNILRKENENALDRIRNEKLLLPDGYAVSLLTEEEYKALAITQGSLTESERKEIESHVRHTHQFLKMLPWTREYKQLTEIAYCHHEKLDGTGYPRGLVSHEIPLQSKIMTIADIYDALTAADRWYKEAVPTSRAIEILALEVKEGKLDPVLFDIFVEKKVYELPLQKDLTRVA